MSISAENYGANKGPFWERFWDCYFKRAILIDLLIGIALIGTNIVLVYSGTIIKVPIIDIKDFYNILLSSILPLVGFIFTAITIIISIKGLVRKTKNPDNLDGVEIFFNSKQYGELIKVLRTVMWELFFVFLILMGLKPLLSYLQGQALINVVIFLLVLMGLGITRTLVLFHLVINMIASNEKKG